MTLSFAALSMTPSSPPPSPLVAWSLRALFALATHAPWLLRAIKPAAVAIAVLASPPVRRAAAANGHRIFGRVLPPREVRRFARGVVGHFYDFVLDVARCRSMTGDELRAKIHRTEGLDAYHACRSTQRGAILVTAHMGSFEVGLAALAGAEPKVHVVFKRDAFAGFDAMRQQLRDSLGVSSVAIDDGWPSLFAMRAALERDEVVVLQADRAMPGQRSQRVPFLHGHLALPIGPVTLARIVGSPIVPVFTVRIAPDRFRVHLLPPIEVDADATDVDGVDPTLRKIAQAIESFIARYPEQWLVLAPAFLEDQRCAC